MNGLAAVLLGQGQRKRDGAGAIGRQKKCAANKAVIVQRRVHERESEGAWRIVGAKPARACGVTLAEKWQRLKARQASGSQLRGYDHVPGVCQGTLQRGVFRGIARFAQKEVEANDSRLRAGDSP